MRIWEFQNSMLEIPKDGPPASIRNMRLLPLRTPHTIHRDDDRWNVSKKKQKFICDQCHAAVSFSRRNDDTIFCRADCEFAGSYVDNSWSDLPTNLRETAWRMCLIDATWHCRAECGAKVTEGQKQQRNKRTAAYTAALPERKKSKGKGLSKGKGGAKGKGSASSSRRQSGDSSSSWRV